MTKPSVIRAKAESARTRLLAFQDAAFDELDGSDRVALDDALAVLRVFEDFER